MKIIELLTEDRAEFVARQLGPKLIARFKQEAHQDLPLAEIILRLLEADPTPNQQYIAWIAKQYISGQFKMEDVPQVKKDLAEFERVKPKLQNKDINTYKDMRSLYDALSPFENQEVVSNKELERRKEAEFFESKQAVLILKTPDLTVVVPKTKQASDWFGRNTKWCTTGEHSLFVEYSRDGPLYIMMTKKGKFQLHIPTRQLVNALNEDVTWRTISSIAPSAKTFSMRVVTPDMASKIDPDIDSTNWIPSDIKPKSKKKILISFYYEFEDMSFGTDTTNTFNKKDIEFKYDVTPCDSTDWTSGLMSLGEYFPDDVGEEFDEEQQAEFDAEYEDTGNQAKQAVIDAVNSFGGFDNVVMKTFVVGDRDYGYFVAAYIVVYPKSEFA